MKFTAYILLLCLIFVWKSPAVSGSKCATPLNLATTPQGYCAFTWATDLGAPRGIFVDTNGDVLVVDQRSSRIIVLWEDASQRLQRTVLYTGNGINHAITIHDRHLYASSPTTVFRWPYNVGNRTNLGNPVVVIRNVPCCHHTTRALVFDSDGVLYVQSGSNANVDPDSSHSQIRTFKLTGTNLDWSTGVVFADGLRNEVGIRFDNEGKLWGVENGVDDLNRPDLGGDIHQDNPSEELNLFARAGLFYGYPYCWSEYKLLNNKSHPIGSQWAQPEFMNDGKHNDDWCQNAANVVPPAYNLPPHTAPLDIFFYYGGTFPNLKGNAFVTLHGSWDRTVPAGYKVLLIKFENGRPVSESNFLAYRGPGDTGNGWNHRPVGLAINKCAGNAECLLITDDGAGSIIAVIAE